MSASFCGRTGFAPRWPGIGWSAATTWTGRPTGQTDGTRCPLPGRSPRHLTGLDRGSVRFGPRWTRQNGSPAKGQSRRLSPPIRTRRRTPTPMAKATNVRPLSLSGSDLHAVLCAWLFESSPAPEHRDGSLRGLRRIGCVPRSRCQPCSTRDPFKLVQLVEDSPDGGPLLLRRNRSQ